MRRAVAVAMACSLAAAGIGLACSTFDEERPADGGADTEAGPGLDAAEAATPGAVVSMFNDPSSAVVDIATSPTKLFFTTNPGGVKACDLRGCTGKPVVLAPSQKPRLLVHANDTLFWFDPDIGKVRGVFTAGGPAFEVLAGVSPKDIAPSTTGLWVSFSNFITRCDYTATDGAVACGPSPGTGGGAEVLASDGAFVYWVNDSYYVIVLDALSGYTSPLALGDSKPIAIFADTDRVFLLRPSGTISVVPRLGGGAEAGVPPSIVTGISSPARLTVTGGTIYVTHLDTSGVGQVLSAPVTGGPTKVLATGLDQPQAIVARDEYLYVGVAHGIVRIRR